MTKKAKGKNRNMIATAKGNRVTVTIGNEKKNLYLANGRSLLSPAGRAVISAAVYEIVEKNLQK